MGYNKPNSATMQLPSNGEIGAHVHPSCWEIWEIWVGGQTETSMDGSTTASYKNYITGNSTSVSRGLHTESPFVSPFSFSTTSEPTVPVSGQSGLLTICSSSKRHNSFHPLLKRHSIFHYHHRCRLLTAWRDHHQDPILHTNYYKLFYEAASRYSVAE